MKMFNSLVESIALCGAEVWGWQEDRRLNGIKRKYVIGKQILGLNWRTPKLHTSERNENKRNENNQKSNQLRRKNKKQKEEAEQKCIKDLEKERPLKEESNWEKKRRERLEKAGMNKE